MKEKLNYLPIGTVIELPFAKIKVMKADGCDGCVFDDCKCCSFVRELFGDCEKGSLEINRKDCNVIFKLIKK